MKAERLTIHCLLGVTQRQAAPLTGDGHVGFGQLSQARSTMLADSLIHPVYINLPVCAFAFVVLWLSLRHTYVGGGSHVSWSHFGQTFDFVGL